MQIAIVQLEWTIEVRMVETVFVAGKQLDLKPSCNDASRWHWLLAFYELGHYSLIISWLIVIGVSFSVDYANIIALLVLIII